MHRPTYGAGERCAGADFVDDLLKAYLRDISHYPLLTPSEEYRLATAIDAGRMASRRLDHGIDDVCERAAAAAVVDAARTAASQLTLANLRLVVDAAMPYRHYAVPIIDLIQEGNLGLMRAVDQFDLRKGKRFSTYAMWWIRKYILYALRVQAPGGGGASWHAAPAPISLDRQVAPASDTPGSLLGDLVADTHTRPDVVVTHASTRAHLANVVNQTPLSVNARRTLELRHGIHDGTAWSYARIGREIGHSHDHARQLHNRACTELRQALTAQQIEPSDLDT